MLAQWRSQWTTLNVQFSDRIASTKLRPITGLKLTHRLRRWLNHSPSLSHHCMFADNWPFLWFSFILYSIAKVECIVISCYLSAHFVYNEFLVISGYDSRRWEPYLKQISLNSHRLLLIVVFRHSIPKAPAFKMDLRCILLMTVCFTSALSRKCYI